MIIAAWIFVFFGTIFLSTMLVGILGMFMFAFDYFMIFFFCCLYFWDWAKGFTANWIGTLLVILIIFVVFVMLYTGIVLLCRRYLKSIYKIAMYAMSVMGIMVFLNGLIIPLITDTIEALINITRLFEFLTGGKPTKGLFDAYIQPILVDKLYGVVLFTSNLANQIFNYTLIAIGAYFIYKARLRYVDEAMQDEDEYKCNIFVDVFKKKKTTSELSEQFTYDNDDEDINNNESYEYQKNYNSNHNDFNHNDTSNDFDFRNSFEYMQACMILGVSNTDSFEKIKSRYRFILKNLHPDSTSDDENSTDYIQKVNSAYEFIKQFYN